MHTKHEPRVIKTEPQSTSPLQIDTLAAIISGTRLAPGKIAIPPVKPPPLLRFLHLSLQRGTRLRFVALYHDCHGELTQD